MSSGLVKRMYTVVGSEEKRIIDTNALLRQRFGELSAASPDAEGEGGVSFSGLQVECVEADPNADGNIVKAESDEGRLEEAKESSRELIESAKAEAEQILAQARAQAETEKQAVFAEAEKRGYSDGMNRIREKEEALLREYGEKEARLEENYRQLIDEMEPQLVDVITQAYEQIFRVDLQSEREILLHLIAGTMHKIDGERNFIVRVSKEDYPYVSAERERLAEGMLNCCIEVAEDVTLAAQECRIETDGGIFDCGLGTQLGELRKKLMLLSWQKE